MASGTRKGCVTLFCGHFLTPQVYYVIYNYNSNSTGLLNILSQIIVSDLSIDLHLPVSIFVSDVL